LLAHRCPVPRPTDAVANKQTPELILATAAPCPSSQDETDPLKSALLLAKARSQAIAEVNQNRPRALKFHAPWPPPRRHMFRPPSSLPHYAPCVCNVSTDSHKRGCKNVPPTGGVQHPPNHSDVWFPFNSRSLPLPSEIDSNTIAITPKKALICARNLRVNLVSDPMYTGCPLHSYT
jgi:hypothetical protein